MTCPYNLKVRKTVTQTMSSIGDAPDEQNSEQIETIGYTMQECPEEECGAWYAGHCNYKGAVE